MGSPVYLHLSEDVWVLLSGFMCVAGFSFLQRETDAISWMKCCCFSPASRWQFSCPCPYLLFRYLSLGMGAIKLWMSIIKHNQPTTHTHTHSPAPDTAVVKKQHDELFLAQSKCNMTMGNRRVQVSIWRESRYNLSWEWTWYPVESEAAGAEQRLSLFSMRQVCYRCCWRRGCVL